MNVAAALMTMIPPGDLASDPAPVGSEAPGGMAALLAALLSGAVTGVSSPADPVSGESAPGGVDPAPAGDDGTEGEAAGTEVSGGADAVGLLAAASVIAASAATVVAQLHGGEMPAAPQVVGSNEITPAGGASAEVGKLAAAPSRLVSIAGVTDQAAAQPTGATGPLAPPPAIPASEIPAGVPGATVPAPMSPAGRPTVPASGAGAVADAAIALAAEADARSAIEAGLGTARTQTDPVPASSGATLPEPALVHQIAAPPAPSVLAPQPAAAAPSATTFVETPELDPNVARIGSLVRSMRGGEIRSATLTLRPAELGEVQVELRTHGGSVSVHLTASHHDGADALRAATSALRRDLEHAGLGLDRVDVGVSGGGDDRRPSDHRPTLDDPEPPGDPIGPRPAPGGRLQRPAPSTRTRGTDGLDLDL